VRIALVIVAVLCILFGGFCVVPSFVTYRALDGEGYVSGSGQMSTSTAALVTRTAQFKEISEEEVEENRVGGETIIRIRAERLDGGDVVVAIGSAEAVQSYLIRGSSETVNDLEFDPFGYRGVALGGQRALPAPDPALFAEYAAGPGQQEITWTVDAGEWRALIMNADGSTNVDVDVRFGVRFPYLRGFAIAGMIIGSAFLLIGVAILVILFRPGRNRQRPEGLLEEAGNEHEGVSQT
jgi:hypothetical protein